MLYNCISLPFPVLSCQAPSFEFWKREKRGLALFGHTSRGLFKYLLLCSYATMELKLHEDMMFFGCKDGKIVFLYCPYLYGLSSAYCFQSRWWDFGFLWCMMLVSRSFGSFIDVLVRWKEYFNFIITRMINCINLSLCHSLQYHSCISSLLAFLNELDFPFFQEKSQAIKRKLDAAMHSESQRSQKTSDVGNIASPFDSDTSSVTAVLNSSEKQPAADGQSTKVTSRAVPVHRRAKVRGAVLHDTEDEEGS